MVLLLAPIHDVSTNKVIDWLVRSKTSYLRIPNSVDSCVEKFRATISSDLSSFQLEYSDGTVLDSNEITSVWFRGGDLFDISHCNDVRIVDQNLKGASLRFLQCEWEHLCDWMYSVLLCKRHLGSPFSYFINKLRVLESAKLVGLSVPNTCICSNKSDVQDFYKIVANQLIAKAISNSFGFTRDGKVFSHPTLSVSLNHIESLPAQIGPSLFQEEIRKQFDVRCFVMNQVLYSTAIMSQENEYTITDFRLLDGQLIRKIPYSIDDSTTKKINLLFGMLNLNFGVVDLIKSVDGTLYFLEVNPLGQFDDVSVSCNYDLEHMIANYLNVNYGS